MTHLVVFTDGACKNNNSTDLLKRAAGSGLLILDAADVEHFRTLYDTKSNWRLDKQCEKLRAARPQYYIARNIPLSDYPDKVTNNIAELLAFNVALETIHAMSPRPTTVDIVPDSKYVINVFNGAEKWQRNSWRTAWKNAPVKNIPLVKQTLVLIGKMRDAGVQINLRHVKAHRKEYQLVENTFSEWFDWFGNHVADWLSNIAVASGQQLAVADPKTAIIHERVAESAESSATREPKRRRLDNEDSRPHHTDAGEHDSASMTQSQASNHTPDPIEKMTRAVETLCSTFGSVGFGKLVLQFETSPQQDSSTRDAAVTILRAALRRAQLPETLVQKNASGLCVTAFSDE